MGFLQRSGLLVLTSFASAADLVQHPLHHAGSQALPADKGGLRSHGRVEIWHVPEMPIGLVVPAALGTPPQPFRLLVELTSGPLFVPSASIENDAGNDEIMYYFANHSATSAPAKPPAWLTYAYSGVIFEGPVMLDYFHVAGLKVAHQPFLNAEEARSQGFIDFWMGYDGVFSLGPTRNSSATATALPCAPWENLVHQGLLERNVFAIDIPKGPDTGSNRPGQGAISLGDINPRYRSSNFSTLPLVGESDRAWTISANSLTWADTGGDDDSHPLHVEFPVGAQAVITSDFFLALPPSWISVIQRRLQLDCGFAGIFCQIECNKRNKLPNFVFGLGKHNFTLTPFDYAPMKIGPSDKQPHCYFDIFPTTVFRQHEAQYNATLVLGIPFLNAFYSVFDLDRREIQLTTPIAS
jgi:saccharopepsin